MGQNARVTRTQRIVVVTASTTAGLALVAISVYMGLERADKVASIVSAVAGLASLAIAAYQMRHTTTNQGSSTPDRQVQRGGDNSTNIQSGGSITFGDRNNIGRD